MAGFFSSKRQMKRAFRGGRGVYEDDQSSFSVRCQEARQRGRLPMTDAIKLVRARLESKGVNATLKQIRTALLASHDGEWHHTSKYGNRTSYYDPQSAVEYLLPALASARILGEENPGLDMAPDSGPRPEQAAETGRKEV
jgi:hypothetical protein